MTISVKPTEATLGALVTDVDLRGLTKETWATINQAFLRYAVLVFPNQHLKKTDVVVLKTLAKSTGIFKKS